MAVQLPKGVSRRPIEVFVRGGDLLQIDKQGTQTHPVLIFTLPRIE